MFGSSGNKIVTKTASQPEKGEDSPSLQPSTPVDEEARQNSVSQRKDITTTGRPKLDKFFVKETALYIVFLVLFSVVTLAVYDEVTYVNINGFREYLVEQPVPFAVDPFKSTFSTISSLQEFYEWLSTVFLARMYPQPVNQYSQTIGAYRIRQIRVKESDCNAPKKVEGAPTTCYGRYYILNEETSPFGVNNTYTWSSSSELGGMEMIGSIGVYGNGGYVVDLPSDSLTNATEVVQSLATNNFFDEATRAIFIDFSLFTANIDQFLVVRLLVEFPSTGGAIPRSDIRAPYLYRYYTTVNYLIMACEIGILLFVIYYLVQGIRDILKFDRSYWKSVWTYVDWFNIVFFLCVAGMRIATMLQANDISYTVTGSKYVEMQSIAFLASQEANINALNGFLMWFKIFKYLRVFPRMNVLVNTLRSASKDIVAFIVMFFVVFIAFSQAFYMSMGRDVELFSTFSNSMSTLFLASMGWFDYDTMTSGNRVLGPFLFVVYMIIVFFILTNVFIAIIVDSYAVVQVQTRNSDESFTRDLISFAKEVVDKVRNRRTKVMEIKEILTSADADNDGVISAEERAAMEAKNKDNKELLEALKKADKDNDGKIDQEELRKIQEEMGKELKSLDQKEQEMAKTGANNNSLGGLPRAHAAVGSDSFLLALIMERFEKLEENVNDINAKLTVAMNGAKRPGTQARFS